MLVMRLLSQLQLLRYINSKTTNSYAHMKISVNLVGTPFTRITRHTDGASQLVNHTVLLILDLPMPLKEWVKTTFN